jgi:signal transduction histidine kinase
MFQTLRPRDEVEGSGMGLALVRKVVERHGGRVHLLDTQGRGTTVEFTWPKAGKGE